MRIYIPIESVTIAHVARPLQVAKELRNQGAEIIFGAQERFRNILEDEGFEVRPLYSEHHSVLLNSVRTLNFKKQVQALPHYLEADMKSIESIDHLDAVIGDFRFTVRMAAEHLNVPHIAITNGYYSPYYAILPGMPRRFAKYLPKQLTNSIWFRTNLKNIMLKQHAKPYQKLCKKYRLNSWIEKGFDIAVSKSLTLLCDLPEFTPQNNLPNHYRFVGPIHWEPKSSSDDILKIFKSDQPLIYITLGTSGEDNALQKVIKSFANKPYNVIISTGKRELSNLPDNIYACPFVRASDILKHASLMICHGGNGSIYQAIQHQVPVLCLTTFYDQEWNGQRVTDLGIGLSFDHKEMKYKYITDICQSLMNDKNMASNLGVISKKMGQWNGAENAAKEIMQYLSSKPTKALS